MNRPMPLFLPSYRSTYAIHEFNAAIKSFETAIPCEVMRG